MKLLASGVRVFVTAEPVDLRCGHDGLAAIVRAQWGDELFAGHLFAFFGRRFDRCKILFWDRGGLVLYYKRLERGRFRPPVVSPDGKAVEMDMTALAMLLDGIDVKRVRRPALWRPKLGERTQGIDNAIDRSASARYGEREDAPDGPWSRPPRPSGCPRTYRAGRGRFVARRRLPPSTTASGPRLAHAGRVPRIAPQEPPRSRRVTHALRARQPRIPRTEVS